MGVSMGILLFPGSGHLSMQVAAIAERLIAGLATATECNTIANLIGGRHRRIQIESRRTLEEARFLPAGYLLLLLGWRAQIPVRLFPAVFLSQAPNARMDKSPLLLPAILFASGSSDAL